MNDFLMFSFGMQPFGEAYEEEQAYSIGLNYTTHMNIHHTP